MSEKKLKIHFLSMECYPMAKVGGLADVVGSLPKYLNKLDCQVEVFIPMYRMPWFEGKKFREVYSSWYEMPTEHVGYRVGRLLEHENLGFDLYVIDIPGKFDRTGVYSDRDGHYFYDEAERHTALQRAYLYYAQNSGNKPDIIHTHDHHTGLVPFMVKNCYEYRGLANTPTVFTIHNQRYQGIFSWDKQYLLPAFDGSLGGLIEWAGVINPLAAGVKNAWKVTTVSPSYMEELKYNSYGLEWLFNNEWAKCIGILNGIDSETWDPATDQYLKIKYDGNLQKFKNDNKKYLLQGTNLNHEMPLVSFIGRFAGEKGADLMPGIIESTIHAGLDYNFVVLGTGDKAVEAQMSQIVAQYPNRVQVQLAYDEKLSHQIYAGSDFLIMPSRVEPCGLNQMYAMRYATIPLVNNIGGLRDSVDYFDGSIGTGYRFNSLNLGDIIWVLKLAQEMYWSKEHLAIIRQNAFVKDFSWDKSARIYRDLYYSLL